MILPSLFAALLTLTGASVSANNPGTPEVRLIGQNLVIATDTPTSVTPSEPCLPQGMALGAVKVRMAREAAEVDRVKLDYGNGIFDEFHVKELLKKGQSTEWLALKTSMQCVERVDVAVLEAKNASGGIPVVQVWGLVDERVK